MRLPWFPRLALILSTILVLVFALLAASAVLTKSPTMDESLHAVGGYAHTFAGDYHINPEDPPLWKYWAMLPHRADHLVFNPSHPEYAEIFVNPERQLWFCADTLYRSPGVDGVRFVNRSRMAMLALAVILAITLMCFAWRAGGPTACLLAGSLVCLDPNFLAHGPLLKNDVAIALVMFALALATYRLGQRITVPRLLLVILLCALGPVVKFSGVLFLPLVAASLLVRAMIKQPWPLLTREVSSCAQRTLVALGVCVLAAGFTGMAIWSSYGFRYTPTAVVTRNMDFEPQVTNAVRHAYFAKHGQWPSPAQVTSLPRPWPVRGILWANDHRLLPQSWLFGLLYTYQSSLVRQTFLMGEIRQTGWWYYFPLAMLFKTPLATLLAIIGAATTAVAWLIMRRFRLNPDDAWLGACIAVPIVLYGCAALGTNLNLGIRHVLPLYPFLFLLAAIVFARFVPRYRRTMTTSGIGLVVLLSVESIVAWPNYIPFFNAAVGGPMHGIALLGDSNLDWGQDLPALAAWQRVHPDERLYLCYFGSADPAHYGIRYINLPSGYLLEPNVQLPDSPGVIAVSATKLQGLLVHPNVAGFYETLRRLPPREILNGTIYLYDFPPRSDAARTNAR